MVWLGEFPGVSWSGYGGPDGSNLTARCLEKGGNGPGVRIDVLPMKNGGYSSQLCDRLPEGYDPYSLSQWLNFKLSNGSHV